MVVLSLSKQKPRPHSSLKTIRRVTPRTIKATWMGRFEGSTHRYTMTFRWSRSVP